MYCGKCGNNVNDDASFCPICGNALAKKNLKVEKKSGKVNLKKKHTNSKKLVTA
ncbi:MAG: zinc-ribbon domain-containing protein [Oliverpabstia sp.]